MQGWTGSSMEADMQGWTGSSVEADMQGWTGSSVAATSFMSFHSFGSLLPILERFCDPNLSRVLCGGLYCGLFTNPAKSTIDVLIIH